MNISSIVKGVGIAGMLLLGATAFGGETPTQRAMNQAVKEGASAKTIRQIAKEHNRNTRARTEYTEDIIRENIALARNNRKRKNA